MEIVFLIGRIILGAYYIFNGMNHFMRLQMMKGYAASKGVPIPGLAVPFTGLMLILGGLSFISGFQPLIGSLLVILFLVPVAFIMHNFWAIADPQMKMVEMVNFTKNLALAASAAMFTLIPTPWPISL